MEGHVEWTMPAPLWTSTGDPSVADNRLKFRTPAILRFATDTFMQDFLNLLSTQPYRLPEFLAAPETWNSPPNEPVPSPQASGLALTLFRARQKIVTQLQARGSKVIGQSKSATPVKILKLFQPSHQRYYLVTTCLVCRSLGLPDRRIDAGNLERATFVLRMLQPNAGADPNNPDPRDCTELALSGGAWQVATNPASLIAGEEQKPLSPVSYTEDDLRQRRLLVGVVPVGDRERLLQAKQPNPSGKPVLPALIDSRQMMLKSQVIYPLCTLEDLANRTVTVAMSVATGGQSTASTITNINNQIQETSWYILLDLARYLGTNLSQLWQEIKNNGNGGDLPPALLAVWNFLNTTSYNGLTFLEALRQACAAADALESVNTTYQGVATGWPNFDFSFYTVTAAAVQYLTPPLDRSVFENLIVQALPAVNPHPPLPPRTVAQAHANPQGAVWFTIRCILERPNCGTLTPPLASEPTAAFQLAAYFDPEAPARPIRIGLPIDTTPAGLRKFDKNTAFVMSDTLCGQVGKLGGMSLGDLVLSVLPFPFHKDLPSGAAQPCPGGMVCSFSIPIITIVALILLIIFVKLFDIIFFWMPFFQICLPLPNFTAKD